MGLAKADYFVHAEGLRFCRPRELRIASSGTTRHRRPDCRTAICVCASLVVAYGGHGCACVSSTGGLTPYNFHRTEQTISRLIFRVGCRLSYCAARWFAARVNAPVVSNLRHKACDPRWRWSTKGKTPPVERFAFTVKCQAVAYYIVLGLILRVRTWTILP